MCLREFTLIIVPFPFSKDYLLRHLDSVFSVILEDIKKEVHPFWTLVFWSWDLSAYFWVFLVSCFSLTFPLLKAAFSSWVVLSVKLGDSIEARPFSCSCPHYFHYKNAKYSTIKSKSMTLCGSNLSLLIRVRRNLYEKPTASSRSGGGFLVLGKHDCATKKSKNSNTISSLIKEYKSLTQIFFHELVVRCNFLLSFIFRLSSERWFWSRLWIISPPLTN